MQTNTFLEVLRFPPQTPFPRSKTIKISLLSKSKFGKPSMLFCSSNVELMVKSVVFASLVATNGTAKIMIVDNNLNGL